MKAFFLSLLVALPLAGCETTVEVVPPAHTPRLALAYTLSNQAQTADYQQFFSARALYTSTSQGVLETQQPQGRNDATAELRDATGQVVEEFLPRGRAGYGSPDSLVGYYLGRRGFVGQPGATYTLRASAPGVEAVEATLTLPLPATLEAGSFVAPPLALGSSFNNYNFNGRLTFAIADNAATTDYYLAYARVLDADGRYWGQVQQDYRARNSDGPDIKLNRFDLSQPDNSYQTLPLSDAGRNGQRLVFSSDITAYYYQDGAYNSQYPISSPPAYLEVIVSSLPAATYEFYQSIQRYYDTDGSPFAEPAPLHSNVTGGYGLFGGATDVKLRIKL